MQVKEQKTEISVKSHHSGIVSVGTLLSILEGHSVVFTGARTELQALHMQGKQPATQLHPHQLGLLIAFLCIITMTEQLQTRVLFSYRMNHFPIRDGLGENIDEEYSLKITNQ